MGTEVYKDTTIHKERIEKKFLKFQTFGKYVKGPFKIQFFYALETHKKMCVCDQSASKKTLGLYFNEEEVFLLQTILSAMAVYISTSIDYLFILLIIFSQSYTKKSIYQIVWGQYLGTGLLVIVSLLAAYVLHFIPEDWVLGLLGLIPIFLGVRFAIVGEEEEEEEEIIERLETRGRNRLFWVIALMTIASGGDNLGIYIPYFTSLSVSEILLVLVVFAIFVAVLCFVSYRLAKISFVSETVERYERIIVPVVFIGLGLFILLENGTIQTLLGL